MPTKVYTLRFSINRCYIIKDKGVIMVDGGPPNKGKSFKRKISKSPVKYEEIQLIVLTHGDFDHVGSAKDIKEITGAKIAIHEGDKFNLEKGRFNWPPGVTPWGKISHWLLAPVLKKIPFHPVKADITLNDQEFPLTEYGIHGKIIYTPGHTAGSVSVLLDTGEAFTGCLSHGFPFRFRPGLPIYAEDLEKIKESWKKVISHGAKMIYPGHGNPFPVEMIKKYLS